MMSVLDPVFSPDPDQTISSGSAKNQDQIQKNPDPDR